MAGDPKNPEIGEIHIDASACDTYAVDLPPGALVGLLAAHAGIDNVVAEITANQAGWGERAGVTALDIAQLTTAHARVQEIDRFLPAARKLVEILEETRAQQDDLRERSVRSIAGSVDTRARKRGNEALLGKYQTSRTYRSEAAMKGVKTRKRNKAEKAASSGNGKTPGKQPAAPQPTDTTQPGGSPQPGNGG